MATQRHPLFVQLLSEFIKDHYEIQTEVPVSELPRKGDIVVLRRQGGPPPPFQGLWSHLTEWNVLEYKSPADSAHEDDLDLLLHVGTGIAYRFNQDRRASGLGRLPPGQVSLWYLAPRVGETFLRSVRPRALFDFEPGGLWRAKIAGFPVWLLSYEDAPVEPDTVPLHLLEETPLRGRDLGELVQGEPVLKARFLGWLRLLKPALWEEVRHMATTTGVIDWAAVSRTTNLEEVVPHIPAKRVVELLGIKRAVEAVGLPAVIEAVGEDEVLKYLLARVPAAKVREIQEQVHKESGQTDTDEGLPN